MTAAGLAVTEAVLTEALDGIPGVLREPCRRIAAGGDRFRAGLVLAVAGRAWPGTSRRTAVAAAAVELLHLATLDVPRLAAGVLIGLSHRLAAEAGAGPLLGDTLVDLCTARALAGETALRQAELRTGTLAAAAARLGAIVTGTAEDGLGEFGLAFGTAAHLLARPLERADDRPALLRTVDDLVERAASARPELADLPRRYRDGQLALIPPRHRTVLNS